MTTCPKCNHSVRIPFFMYLSSWPFALTCPHCHTKLERKPPNISPLLFLLFIFFLPWETESGRIFALSLIAIGAIVTVVQCLRIELRVRQSQPNHDTLTITR
jgi:hypothetical protein